MIEKVQPGRFASDGGRELIDRVRNLTLGPVRFSLVKVEEQAQSSSLPSWLMLQLLSQLHEGVPKRPE